ncbi:Uncharacterized conserved protein [Nitrosomonas sp. Nm51]|uniref:exopolysaccharide biosynthesis protein n=1 Tax=Nitrosomonas sp. Nm51 TaxID=133720 RepID=UPI0008D118AF|nr:exopolysaccharide biosynthesis protein [Nitrosomonas sp. Nm51]SER54805.1 Uncharacterized conserved protein [Nitrosomonas sp. Nm51]
MKNETGNGNGTNGLTEILSALSEKANGVDLSFGQIIDALEYRGFGPLLVAPSLIIILPTGAIPGVPAVCGIFIFLICFQIVLGYKRPWLPDRLKSRSIRKSTFEKGFQKIRPYTETIDRYVGKRLTFFARNDLSKKIIALLSMVLALCVILIGFIPMMPAILALPILLFALGLSVADGILLAAGYGAIGFVAATFPFFWDKL